MNTTKFSNILLDKAPKNINKVTEEVIDVLFDVNEVIRELNSIDFCNPLGYILTKALPPEGFIANKLKEYGSAVTDFINEVTTKINNNSNTDELVDDIEGIRLLLEDIIPDEDLARVIPGGDGILKVIQSLNDSLVVTNTLLSIKEKKQLINSFKKRLIPLSNPINLAELLLGKKADELNKALNKLIKPERFVSDLQKLIKLIVNIDKSIAQIRSIMSLINKIIKSINVLIKITKLTIKILKKLPMPAKYVTVGMTVTSSSKVTKFEMQIDDLSKLLSAVSTFISKSVIKQISRIRREIFILLIGLNQLLENLKACPYFDGNILLTDLSLGIDSLNSNLQTLEELFPSSTDDNKNGSSIYNGYKIEIIKESTTDNNTNLFRRRVIVTNSENILEYESTSTYTNKDSVLIKEGQFYIDSKNEVNTTDRNNNSITDEEAEILLLQMGLVNTSLEESNKLEKQSNEFLQDQISKNPEDKKQYDLLNNDNENPNPVKIEQIRKIAKSISSLQKNSNLVQIRLKLLSNSLQSKGYTLEEIHQGLNSQYHQSYNIVIENNNITINKK